MPERKHFQMILREALERRFGHHRITASELANAFNLITNESISDEAARKWLTGLSLPRYERIFELAIEAGADECKSNNDFHEIQCPVNEIYNVKKELEREINNFISTEIEWIPLNSVKISEEKWYIVYSFKILNITS